MTDLDQLKVKLIRKLAVKGVTGNHKKEIDTVKQWGVPTHEQGTARKALEELVRNPEAPVEMYGGRDTIRLTGMQEAKEYLEANGGELPWGLQD